MKKGLLLITTLFTTGHAYAYNPATREQQVEQTALLTEIEANTAGGGGGGSNASVGLNGAAAPTSSTQVGFLSGANLINVSATNPLPITGSISATNPSVSATGAAVPAQATMAGGSDGTNLRALKVSATGVLSVDGSAVTQPVSAASLPLPTGAATAAKQPALGTAGTASADVITVQGIASMTALKVDGSAVTQPVSAASLPLPTGASTAANQTTGNSSLSSIDGKTPALGQAVMAASTPVVIASNQSAIPVTVGATTHAYVDSVRNDYSSTNVTTGAWVELIASTAGAIAHLQIFDSSGQTMELGIGAAASETRILIIPPGGLSSTYDINIPTATRISIRAISATANSGEIDITGTN